MINRIEVDVNAIANNLRVIRKKIDPETKIIGVVKANAYGHGLVETARAVWTSGADILAVFSLDEAVALRVGKIRAQIIVLGYVEPSEFRRMIDFDITYSLSDMDSAKRLAEEGKRLNKWARVDIAVDTGMNRYGFPRHDFVFTFEQIASLNHLKITGLHSHFAAASDREFSKEQLGLMQDILFGFQQRKITPPLVHMAATESTFKYPEAHFDAVRVGLGLYGYYGFETKEDELKPALEFKTKITQIKRILKGQSIGYKRTYIAKGPMKIAVLPVGYADGYQRSISNRGTVLVGGKRAKVVGLICMNAMMVDITGLKGEVGDDVILIGKQGDGKVYADEVAKWAETVPHEILSRLSPTLHREFHFK